MLPAKATPPRLGKSPHSSFALVLFKYHAFGALRLAGTKGRQENHTNEEEDSYHGSEAYKGRITLSNSPGRIVGLPHI